MNLGGPEVLILFIFIVLGAILYCTVYAIIRAATNGDTAWIIGIIAGWIVGVGWLVGLVYLLSIDGPRRHAGPVPATISTAPSFRPPPVAPAGPEPGWHADPYGRAEQRYWDGGRWTEHVMRGAEQTTDPV